VNSEQTLTPKGKFKII